MKDLSSSHPTITTELDTVGGESLGGSGFETETPEPDVVSSDERAEE